MFPRMRLQNGGGRCLGRGSGCAWARIALLDAGAAAGEGMAGELLIYGRGRQVTSALLPSLGNDNGGRAILAAAGRVNNARGRCSR